MNWVDIIVVVILTLSFLGGLKEGAVKNLFSLIAVLIAIPCAGLTYRYLASVLSFLPGTNWENFIAFFIAMGVISAILHLIFLLPRKIARKIWGQGFLFRILGGILNVIQTSIGMVVFLLVLNAYPILDWLARYVSGSTVLVSLAALFSFIQIWLPAVIQRAAPMVSLITSI